MPFKSVKATMDEWKAGNLHSGKGGPIVTSQRQALAIALSMKRRAGRRKRSSRLAHTLAAHSRRMKKRPTLRKYV